jgi:hypothetical protein
MKFKKSSIVATVAAIGILGSATAAYAFVAMTGQGSGNGSKVVASSNFHLKVEVVNPTTLVPGTPSTVTIKVTNDSAANGKIKLSNVALSLPSTPVNGCSAEAWSTLHLTNPTVPAGTLLQKGDVGTFTGLVAMDDSDTADQTCLLDQDLNITANVS